MTCSVSAESFTQVRLQQAAKRHRRVRPGQNDFPMAMTTTRSYPKLGATAPFGFCAIVQKWRHSQAAATRGHRPGSVEPSSQGSDRPQAVVPMGR